MDVYMFSGIMIIFGALLYRFLISLIYNIKTIKVLSSYKKEYNRLKKEAEEYRKQGNFHEWEEAFYMGVNIRFCKATGFIPSKNAYLSQKEIGILLSLKERIANLEEKHGLLASSLVPELSIKYGLTTSISIDVVDFFLERLKDEKNTLQ